MSSTKVYLAFDGRMALHTPLPAPQSSPFVDSSSDEEEEGRHNHFEIPRRIFAIYEKLMELEAADGYRRFVEIPCIEATREAIELVHSAEHYDFMARTEGMTEEELRILAVPNTDLYYCPKTFMAAKLAVGGVVECVNAVTNVNRKSNRAIAIVRPPGHHAERNEAMGTSSNRVPVATMFVPRLPLRMVQLDQRTLKIYSSPSPPFYSELRNPIFRILLLQQCRHSRQTCHIHGSCRPSFDC